MGGFTNGGIKIAGGIHGPDATSGRLAEAGAIHQRGLMGEEKAPGPDFTPTLDTADDPRNAYGSQEWPAESYKQERATEEKALAGITLLQYNSGDLVT